MRCVSTVCLSRILSLVLATSLAQATTARAGTLSRDVYLSGHCDLCADYDKTEGKLELNYHFHSGGYYEGSVPGTIGNSITPDEYAPSSLYTRVPDSSATPVSDYAGTKWNLLGATGSNVWVLPSSLSQGQVMPYLGFGTDELDDGSDTEDDTSDDHTWSNITYSILGVDCPTGGNFSMWTGTTTPTFYWASSDGITSSDAYSQGIGGHNHANFGFTTEGVYEVQMQLGATRDGVAVTSDVETFTFLVGNTTIPEPSTFLLLLTGAAVAVWTIWRQRSSERR